MCDEQRLELPDCQPRHCLTYPALSMISVTTLQPGVQVCPAKEIAFLVPNRALEALKRHLRSRKQAT